jgi:general secretion pathway protein I
MNAPMVARSPSPSRLAGAAGEGTARSRRAQAGSRRAAGFTLIEVLVASAIVAIGLTAALRASQVGTDGVAEHRDRMLAGWVAENVAAERSARRDWPAPGDYRREESLAGRRFLVAEAVKTTPNPRFRRLDVSVARAEDPGRVLRHLAIFLNAP